MTKRKTKGLACLEVGCEGEIQGPYNPRRGCQWFIDGDEHSCPKCGAKYSISVTDDYEDDAVASLVPEVA